MDPRRLIRGILRTRIGGGSALINPLPVSFCRLFALYPGAEWDAHLFMIRSRIDRCRDIITRVRARRKEGEEQRSNVSANCAEFRAETRKQRTRNAAAVAHNGIE
jgi:hypothetical protein